MAQAARCRLWQGRTHSLAPLAARVSTHSPPFLVFLLMTGAHNVDMQQGCPVFEAHAQILCMILIILICLPVPHHSGLPNHCLCLLPSLF